MKKIIYISIGVCFTFLLVTCGLNLSYNFEFNSYSSPNSVATRYLTFLMHKNYDKAKKLATKETAQNLDMMKVLDSDFGITVVKDVKCKIVTNDEASCTFCCSKDTSFKELKLRKEGNQWLAHQPKEVPPLDTAETITPKSAEEMERDRKR